MGVLLHENPPLTPPDDTPGLASVTVGPDQEACCVWTSPHDDRIATLTQQGVDGTIWQTTSMTRALPRFPMVQPHPVGWIVIGQRCHEDNNVLILTPDGRVAGRSRVGDAVHNAYTTRSGQLWTSYFDEGILDEPSNGSGCLRWEIIQDPHGFMGLDLTWRMPGGWVDCYALNVTDHASYALLYPGFPIAAIKDDRARMVASPEVSAGATAMVTDGYRMALVGSYSRRDRVVLGTLEGDKFHRIGTTSYHVDGIDGTQVAVQGRCDHLHGFAYRDNSHGPNECRWWSCALDDLWAQTE